MKLLHVISDLNLNSGGPSLSVYLLVQGLRDKGIDAEILTLTSSQTSNGLISKEDFIKLIKLPGKFSFGFSTSFIEYLKNSEYDIFHGHGLWQLPVHFMATEALKKNAPYIISPRGMLEPWSLEQKKLKKKIALRLYQYSDLKNAACLHATSEMEANNIRKLGFKNPVAVIPNGLNISEFPIKNINENKEKRTVLFLSRIHYKKGLELLIEAWSRLDKSLRKNWQIIIAGNGEENYINVLNKLITNKNLINEIKIIGPKFGKEKIDTYHSADLFVLPTYSENFGMVVAEALACGLPVITTKGTPWEELISHNAGWWIDIGIEPLAFALTEAMSLDDEVRKTMGLNGRKLVEEKYSIDSVAQKMIQLYEWILGKREKPEFVYE